MTDAQPMTVETWEIARVRPYEANPRRNDDAVEAVAASIREFGFRQPIVVDAEGVIIAGHTRLKAAQHLGLDTVPVHVADLSPERARAYRIADNKLHELTNWDTDTLAEELAAIMQNIGDIDPESLGFDEGEIDRMVAELDEADAEQGDADAEPPKPPASPVTQAGDLWVLGRHRLLCGDSKKAENVDRLMGGERAALCFTSPPYLAQRDYGDEQSEYSTDWDAMMCGVFANVPMTDSGQVMVNLGMIHHDGEWHPYWQSWIEWMRDQGWRRFGWYVWDQGSGLPGRSAGRCGKAHEFVFHFNREAAPMNKTIEKKPKSMKPSRYPTFRPKYGSAATQDRVSFCKDTHRVADSVWRISRAHTANKLESAHPAVFPVGLPQHAMMLFDGYVYEPFCGSGTTIIAGEQEGRRVFAMELSPAYVDVAVLRWQRFTGEIATRYDAEGNERPGITEGETQENDA